MVRSVPIGGGASFWVHWVDRRVFNSRNYGFSSIKIRAFGRFRTACRCRADEGCGQRRDFGAFCKSMSLCVRVDLSHPWFPHRCLMPGVMLEQRVFDAGFTRKKTPNGNAVSIAKG